MTDEMFDAFIRVLWNQAPSGNSRVNIERAIRAAASTEEWRAQRIKNFEAYAAGAHS